MSNKLVITTLVVEEVVYRNCDRNQDSREATDVAEQVKECEYTTIFYLLVYTHLEL